MKIIRDILARDLDKQIEEVIKLDQRDEQTVHDEITEYVATDRILEQYREILQAIADGPGEPDERTSVWISGFFGSGKSSFAKNIGYVLANRKLLGTPAGKLFTDHLKAQRPGDQDVSKISDLVDFINTRIPTHAIMFDVQVDRAVRRADETLAEIMYSVLLRELDYADDFDVAELEIELETEGRLMEFIEACSELFAQQMKGLKIDVEVPVTLEGISPEIYAVWARIRKGAQKIQRASAAMHKIDPKTYPNEDSWAHALHDGVEFTIRLLVSRTFDLVARRKPGQSVVYIIDEVGQYAARSVEKIENLRKVAEHFGQESHNRVSKGEAVAPVWVIVTSQEKLDEVVAAIDDKRVQLARMQDRFYYRIDLAPADIREVATKRVLPKTEEGAELLRQLYKDHSGQLKTHTQAERSQINFDFDEEEFVQFYPCLPHFIELSIDIVSGMRLQPGAPRHIGGSNRTIIKQTYEMLVSDRTNLAEEAIGTLVTLDRIYDLIEGNLPSETQKDVSDIGELWPDSRWPGKVAKTISLLEFVRGLPRTEKNIAAVLYESLEAGSPSKKVDEAIEMLADKDFIRQTEDGWKLLTKIEKNWATERSGLNPTPKERNDIWEEQLRAIFEEPSMNRFQREGRTFRLDVAWEGRKIAGGKGQIPLELIVSDGSERFDEDAKEVRKRSREEIQTVFWIFSSSNEIDDLVAELYRSQRMAAKYEQLRAQGKISPQETGSLSSEKLTALRLAERLKAAIQPAFKNGEGYLDGVRQLGSDLGDKPSEILRALVDSALPKLYQNLEQGNVPITGKEAEEILKAANLTGLSNVFYDVDGGLGLVVKEGDKFVFNVEADVAKIIRAFMDSEHGYGNKVTGRMLEDEFGGLGYGWDVDLVKLVLATLLRAGAVELTYQGRKFRNHLEPQVRTPLTGTQAFRAASFAPREAIDLSTLVDAAKRYEAFTGEEVDVDETSIAHAFREFAKIELDLLLPVEAAARANHIPVVELLLEYEQALRGIIQSPSDDVVRTLSGEGESFNKLRGQVAQIREALTESGLERLETVRIVLNRMWPALNGNAAEPELGRQVETARVHLMDAALFENFAAIEEVADTVEKLYRDRYQEKHSERSLLYRDAIETIKGIPEWSDVPKAEQGPLLLELTNRACGDEESGSPIGFTDGSLTCTLCTSSLDTLESDISAVTARRNHVAGNFQALIAPEDRIERVHVSEVAGAYQVLSSHEDIERVLNEIREHITKLMDLGAKVILE